MGSERRVPVVVVCMLCYLCSWRWEWYYMKDTGGVQKRRAPIVGFVLHFVRLVNPPNGFKDGQKA